MGFPGLDVIFRYAAPTVDPLIERSGFAAGKIGDDEPGVAALLARFDTGEDALDPAPTLGTVKELREAPHLAFGGSRGKARLGARLQASDMPAQGGGRGHAEDEVNAVGSAPIVTGRVRPPFRRASAEVNSRR